MSKFEKHQKEIRESVYEVGADADAYISNIVGFDGYFTENEQDAFRAVDKVLENTDLEFSLSKEEDQYPSKWWVQITRYTNDPEEFRIANGIHENRCVAICRALAAIFAILQYGDSENPVMIVDDE